MSWNELALIYGLVLLGCLFGGIYIGVALGITGIVGITVVYGTSLWASLGDIVWNTSTHFTLVAIPLFILMGEIILQCGIANRFYTGLAPWFRRLPGGLAQTNIVGCAVFSAVSGSSVATVLTIGSIALKEMRTRGYKDSLTLGTLTAGGGLGILIPPSIPLIVYSSITNEPVISLFMGGIVPGLLLAFFYSLFVGIRALRDPSLCPSREQAAEQAESGSVVRDTMPIALLVGGVILSMYGGVVTPTEASALGALLAGVVALYYGGLNRRSLTAAFTNTVISSSVILLITICAQILQYGIVVTGFGKGVSSALLALELSPLLFFCILLLIYAVLGMLMDGLSMMLITVPLIYAPMIAMGFDGVWFGIILVLMIELGAITPPVGLNLFALQSISPETPLSTIAWSSLPYCIIIVAFSFFCYALPDIVLWLPGTMH